VKSEVQILSPRFLSRRNRSFGAMLVLALALAVVATTTALAEQAEISGTANVYLRSGPSADSPTVGVLSAGEKVTIVSSQGVWTRVVTSDARVGYLNRRFLTPTGEGQEVAGPTPEAAPVASGERGASAAPSQSPAVETKQELSEEMAALRSEISELKRNIERQRDEADLTTPPDDAATSVARTPPVAIQTGNDSGSAPEQGVGVLAVAMLCLIIGWVLGSTFTRRRTRSQRSRLRF
ncbi:MAG: SH3 domain-containing protein, partial [Candidatus Binatia bacterium]